MCVGVFVCLVLCVSLGCLCDCVYFIRVTVSCVFVCEHLTVCECAAGAGWALAGLPFISEVGEAREGCSVAACERGGGGAKGPPPPSL